MGFKILCTLLISTTISSLFMKYPFIVEGTDYQAKLTS